MHLSVAWAPRAAYDPGRIGVTVIERQKRVWRGGERVQYARRPQPCPRSKLSAQRTTTRANPWLPASRNVRTTSPRSGMHRARGAEHCVDGHRPKFTQTKRCPFSQADDHDPERGRMGRGLSGSGRTDPARLFGQPEARAERALADLVVRAPSGASFIVDVKGNRKPGAWMVKPKQPTPGLFYMLVRPRHEPDRHRPGGRPFLHHAAGRSAAAHQDQPQASRTERFHFCRSGRITRCLVLPPGVTAKFALQRVTGVPSSG